METICANCKVRLARVMDINNLCEPCANLKLTQDLQNNTAALGNATTKLFSAFFDSNNGPLGLRMLMLASWPISTYIFWQVSDWGFFGKLAMCVIGSPFFILPGGAMYGLYYLITVVLKNKDEITIPDTDSSSSPKDRKILIISLVLILLSGIYYLYTKNSTSVVEQNPVVAINPVAEIASAPASVMEPEKDISKEETSSIATARTEEKINPSFDCTKASNNLEKLICSDVELSRIDVQLNDVYLSFREKVADKAALKKDQIQWMKNARQCSDKDCILQSYKQRIAELSASN